MNKKLLLSLSLMSLTLAAQAQYRSQVWCPDNGDGTYTNPVINADYSDPDVCRAQRRRLLSDGIELSLHTRTAHSALQGLGELADSGLCAEKPLHRQRGAAAPLWQ